MSTGATLNSTPLATLSVCPKVSYVQQQQQQPINYSCKSSCSSFPLRSRRCYVSYAERTTQRSGVLLLYAEHMSRQPELIFVCSSSRVESEAHQKHLQPIFAVLQAEKEGEVLTSEFEEFTIAATGANEDGEIKVSVEVYGPKTQALFDHVFAKMIEAAQPIPGFRREKGGKTPNIPKDVLLEILGPSKVYKQVIKNVINSTVAVYIQKTDLKVSKHLKVEQSFEDLETSFEPGETFSFDAVVQQLE